MQTEFYRHWHNILKNFDWVKVQKVMEALDWKYANTPEDLNVPSIGELIITAQELCESAWQLGEGSIGTGGFYAACYTDSKREKTLGLTFEVTSWESYREVDLF